MFSKHLQKNTINIFTVNFSTSNHAHNGHHPRYTLDHSSSPHSLQCSSEQSNSQSVRSFVSCVRSLSISVFFSRRFSSSDRLLYHTRLRELWHPGCFFLVSTQKFQVGFECFDIFLYQSGWGVLIISFTAFFLRHTFLF